MAQPHFLGLPDLGLNLTRKIEPGKLAGTDGYCCRFDTLANAGDGASARKARDALLVGSQGGLDLYRILPDKLEVVGRLEGLRGAVIDAKVIPHTERIDSLQSSRPLVAITLHGLMSDDRRDSGQADEAKQEPGAYYQTTVEVYSLRHQQRVATLYQSVPVALEPPTMGHLSLPPAPVGDLRLEASGGFLTVASGKSGEVFVFSSITKSHESHIQFRCIGKFWTSLQQRPPNPKSRPPSSNEAKAGDGDVETRPGVPLLCLSSRWLAVVPPYTSAKISIQGSPLVSDSNPQPTGLSTHIAPSQPLVTCEIAGTDAEGTLSWLSRKAAQGLVKASQRGYEMSVQGWRELTHPSPPTAPQSHHRSTSGDAEIFPPTNAPADDPRRLAREPALVSLIDLRKLLDAEEHKPKQPPPPLATFALVKGCNHLSFSPDGLRLLTSNRKGEVSTIWDLTHAVHGSVHADLLDEEAEMERGPHIKQSHRIARSSPSVIIDSVWPRDGDWLALLTTHGTIHVHDIPSPAASNKRKRKSTVPATSPEKAEPTVSVSQGMSPPSSNAGFWGSLRSGVHSVGMQVNAIRSQNTLPTTFAGFRETAAAARTASGRAVAKGLSQGYSAARSGASDMWHAEDNKVRHKSLQDAALAGCVRWMQRQGDSSLLVVCGGAVHLHPVQKVTRRKGDVDVTGLKQDKYGHKTFALPHISTGRDGSATKPSKCAEEGPHGFWSLRQPPTNSKTTVAFNGHPAPSSSAEVETNPPYCPFHVDSRINIHAFEDDTTQVSEYHTQGHGVEDEEPWVFGAPLPPSIKVNEGSGSEFIDGQGLADRSGDDDVDDMAEQVESRLTVHKAGSRDGGDEIRVSMRRSRPADGGGEMGMDLLGDDGDDGLV